MHIFKQGLLEVSEKRNLWKCITFTKKTKQNKTKEFLTDMANNRAPHPKSDGVVYHTIRISCIILVQIQGNWEHLAIILDSNLD